MKYLIILLFLALPCIALGQYGRLEPIDEGDTTFMVMRTSKEMIEKLKQSPDKNTREIGREIVIIEQSLDLWRGNYNLHRLASPNMFYFIKILKSLEKKGFDVSNYVQEAKFYHNPPRRGAY